MFSVTEGCERFIIGKNRERWELGQQMHDFTYHLRRVLVTKISGSRKWHFVVWSNLYRNARFGKATIVCSVYFIEKKKHWKREKWDRLGRSGTKSGKKWDRWDLEMRSGLDVKTASDKCNGRLGNARQIQAEQVGRFQLSQHHSGSK